MEKPVEVYWHLRLNKLKESMEKNNFEVFIAENKAKAKAIVIEEILPKTEAQTVSYGGSMTAETTGVFDALKQNPAYDFLEISGKDISAEEKMERRRRSLLVDAFITGSNAITEQGQLVNLDMIGNRIGGITFGPKHVIIMVGRNKIVRHLEEAMHRIKNFAAPANSIKLNKKNPCVKTSFCEECKSAERICNTWTITEKSFPKKRVKVVLINEDLGL